MSDWTRSCGHSVHDDCDCGEPCEERCEKDRVFCIDMGRRGMCKFANRANGSGRAVPLDPKALRALRERDRHLPRDRGGFFLLKKKP